MLADADVVSRTKLATTLELDPRVLGGLLSALVKAELLIEVPAKGLAKIAVSKPRKYLFMSPAIRATFQQIAGLVETEETRKGRLLEDLVGLYMYREFVTRQLGYLAYNPGEGHADFTLQTNMGTQIPIEVGMGRKTARQVLTTMKEMRSTYGIVISATHLAVNPTENILFLPLPIFYLM
jgi:predicted AAA+ superfamily ATPase